MVMIGYSRRPRTPTAPLTEPPASIRDRLSKEHLEWPDSRSAGSGPARSRPRSGPRVRPRTADDARRATRVGQWSRDGTAGSGSLLATGSQWPGVGEFRPGGLRDALAWAHEIIAGYGVKLTQGNQVTKRHPIHLQQRSELFYAERSWRCRESNPGPSGPL
jgi:hypothetical protein